MFAIDSLILIGGLLLLFAIGSSKASARVGVPVLVLFLAVGMLAGSEGIGGLSFDNYELAHGIGTLALAVILFDGGLRTPLSSFRVALAPSLTLATFGVILTAALTGVAAAMILDVTLMEGILLGAIVGSTDAAAVFAVLRGQRLHLRERVAATLEIESGSNDPTAIFLTVGILQVMLGGMEPGWGLVGFFLLQAGVGLAVGVVVGRLAVEVNNRINLDAAGLYPILASASGLLAFGLAANLSGSGFLSVYVAGIIIGNSRIIFQRGILHFMDGMAWLSQIVMFVVLGMLSFPSQLVQVAIPALLVAAVLILVARPIAVTLLLLPFRFEGREIAFLSWVGLKGAVPIVLATYPLLFGLPNGLLLFNVVFFVVLVSALTQGWSLNSLAKRLGLEVPAPPAPPVTLEITSLKHVDGDIVEFTVGPDSRASGRRVRDLALPEGVVIALISRGHEMVPPRGSTRIEPGDHVFVVLRHELRPFVNRMFSPDQGHTEVPATAAFVVYGATSVQELQEFYDLETDAPPTWTVARLMQERLPAPIHEGDRIKVGGITLYVREIGEHGIERVALELPESPIGVPLE